MKSFRLAPRTQTVLRRAEIFPLPIPQPRVCPAEPYSVMDTGEAPLEIERLGSLYHGFG